MSIDRRRFLAAAAAAALPVSARADALADSAGRSVPLSGRVGRVLAAGGPAAVAVYCLRPDALLGWPRAPYPEERPFLLPPTRDLPETGMLTGRGDTANIERLMAMRPDLIVDFGSVLPTYVSLADRTQRTTGVPYALVDGRFAATAASLRLLGRLLDAGERAEALAAYAEALFVRVDEALAQTPPEKRPSVYLARGPNGLETGLLGSINTEIIERAGGRNVAAATDGRRGIANVSPEQILLWDPDVVITWDRAFHDNLRAARDPLWSNLRAVREGRVHLAPTAPFGWIDRPPSLNRLIGLSWLAHIFLGDRFAFDLEAETRAFYKLFYQVDVSGPELAGLIAWANGAPPDLQRR